MDKSRYVNAAAVGPLLASADYHGAMVDVVRCRCVGRVGIKGIVVKDTKFTMEIITPKNELKSMLSPFSPSTYASLLTSNSCTQGVHRL